ncbi:19178_t:CDS:2, partial [Gigaspora margarita]
IDVYEDNGRIFLSNDALILELASKVQQIDIKNRKITELKNTVNKLQRVNSTLQEEMKCYTEDSNEHDTDEVQAEGSRAAYEHTDEVQTEGIEQLTNFEEKALIYQEKLQKIKEVLLDPKNTILYTSTFRFWAKNKLQKIVDSYIVLHHTGQKETWNRISSKWGYSGKIL